MEGWLVLCDLCPGTRHSAALLVSARTVPGMCSMSCAPGSTSRPSLIKPDLEIGCYQQPAARYCCFWKSWVLPHIKRSAGLRGRWQMRAAPKHLPWNLSGGSWRVHKQKNQKTWGRCHRGSAEAPQCSLTWMLGLLWSCTPVLVLVGRCVKVSLTFLAWSSFLSWQIWETPNPEGDVRSKNTSMF